MADVEPDARAPGVTIGARVDPEELRRIDLARVYGRYASRSDLIAQAVREHVARILAAHGVAS